MDIGLMIEGQNGLTWERWIHIVALAERLGFPSLFRADHYFLLPQRQEDSLETWLSLTLAATHSQRLRFGPLVTPVTFRHPVDLARMAAQIDLLSGGRFVLGLGAGWNQPEYTAYGLPFAPAKERLDRLEESIQLIKALWTDSPASFNGRYYQLDGADMLPKPAAGRPPLIIGGAGERRTLRLAAQYADEWSSVMLTPPQLAAKLQVLARHCQAVDRDPAEIRISMMAFALIGPTPAHVERATRYVMELYQAKTGTSPEAFRAERQALGMISGSTDEVIDYLGRLAEVGLHEIQLQHLLFDSDDIPEYFAAEIMPAASAL